MPGPITHGEAFAVQPFSNIVTTKTMTGAQIETVLEQQLVTSAAAGCAARAADPAGVRRASPTRGTASVPAGDKVDPRRSS